MENKNLKEESPKANNNLEWGDHNPKLTDDNFIDRNPKKISDQNELLAPIDLSEVEPGRNRKGVKEGQSIS